MNTIRLFLLFLYFFLPAVVAPGQIIHTVAGTRGIGGYSGNGGPATAAILQDPQSVAIDTLGNLYIADGDNDVIQKVDTAGIITIIAGNGGRGYSGDGGPATNATLNSPTGLSIDNEGTLYFADFGNHVARKISTAGIVTTFAGKAMQGYSGDGGAATSAKIAYPISTAVDLYGNVYISDIQYSVVRKVSSTGIITTFAGNSVVGHAGDNGPATDAELSVPYGLAVDGTGCLLIADSHNNAIRKVDTSGIITTIAGTGVDGFSGDGGPASAAQFSAPLSLSVNNQAIYVADLGNSTIRKINSLGIISTVAGCNINGYSGDGGLAIYARINHPLGVTADRYGNFYFGDIYDFVVRKVDTSHALAGITPINKPHGLQLYPDPVTTDLTVAAEYGITSLQMINCIGQTIFSMTTPEVLQLHINTALFPSGLYFLKINNCEVTRFLKQ